MFKQKPVGDISYSKHGTRSVHVLNYPSKMLQTDWVAQQTETLSSTLGMLVVMSGASLSPW